MKSIELLKNLKFGEIEECEKSKEVKEVFNGSRRRLVEVKLRNDEVLAKHKAVEPITVLCLAGNGVFRAGANLGEEQTLVAGTLITLEGGVEHEVVAQPALDLLVTKFKDVQSEMKNDIEARADIDDLMNRFYGCTLRILIKKDFSCLEPRDGEEDTDTFAHPFQNETENQILLRAFD